jgi:hypothetical protein
MGRGIDQPTTKWDEMFLPSEVGRNIADWQYTDESGKKRPLVSHIEQYNTAEGRPAILDAPPPFWSSTLVPGLVLAVVAGVLWFLNNERHERHEKKIRKALGIYQAAMGLFFGFAGSLLFFLTFFTDHDYAWHDINVIFVNPVMLALVPCALIAGFSRIDARRERMALVCRLIWAYVFVFGVVSLAAHWTGIYVQDNFATLVLLLPVSGVLGMVSFLINRGPHRPRGRAGNQYSGTLWNCAAQDRNN